MCDLRNSRGSGTRRITSAYRESVLIPRSLATAALTAVLAMSSCPPALADGDFAGLVAIAPGRSLFINCQGSGSPTVLVIPGKGSYAEAWNVEVPGDDPVRSSPYDLISQARLEPSTTAAQPTVAKGTRVCVYDRPNTRPDGPDRSTPVRQPHSIVNDVDDIVKLLPAAHISTPVVVAAHSYGGLIADLLARTHPDLVSGLVMVDPTSEFLPSVGNPAQNAAFYADAAAPMPDPDSEGFLAQDDFAKVKAAPPLPSVPAIVLSSDKFPPPEALKPENYTLEQIQRANTLLANALGTVNLTNTDSGHNIMLYQPQVVAGQILATVNRVRVG
jgi:pimeloyl-ACP methyl ester carboxylesterase